MRNLIGKLTNRSNPLIRDQRGITGLETALVLFPVCPPESGSGNRPSERVRVPAAVHAGDPSPKGFR